MRFRNSQSYHDMFLQTPFVFFAYDYKKPEEYRPLYKKDYM